MQTTWYFLQRYLEILILDLLTPVTLLRLTNLSFKLDSRNYGVFTFDHPDCQLVYLRNQLESTVKFRFLGKA